MIMISDRKVVQESMLNFIPEQMNENSEIDRFISDVQDWDVSVPGFQEKGCYQISFLVKTFISMWVNGIYDED